MTKSTKSWAIYLAYTFALTAAFLYILFPGDKLAGYIERSVSESGKGIALTIDKMRPAFPIGLQFLGGEIALRERSDIGPLKVERLGVFPHIRSCLSGSAVFDLKASVYKGKVAGTVRFDGYKTSGPFSADIHIKGVMLEDIALLRDLTDCGISGSLSGDITYDYKSGMYMRGSGESSLVVTNGSVELLVPFLDPGPVKFQSVETIAKLARGRLTIEELKLEGDLFRCDLSGTIILARRAENSVMNLRGNIEPLESSFEDDNLSGAVMGLLGKEINMKKIPFSIAGTIKNPKVRFM